MVNQMKTYEPLLQNALEKEIYGWLSRIVRSERPSSSVIAYNIGLFKTVDGYSAYVIGSEKYDDEDSDWACEEAFVPTDKYLMLPSSQFELGDWETAMREIVKAVKSVLGKPDMQSSFFVKAQALTVGFDSGDLERVL